MFIRARYGHGARLGYEKEWRGKKDIAGGGEWLDQGSHLIDLSRAFGGEFESGLHESRPMPRPGVYAAVAGEAPELRIDARIDAVCRPARGRIAV